MRPFRAVAISLASVLLLTLPATSLLGGVAGTQEARAADMPSPRGSGLEFIQTLADLSYLRLDSLAAEHTYHVYVRVPPGYHAGSEDEERLPTVYLLDAGVTLPLLAGYQRYLELSEEAPEAILVGISYGNDDWQGGNSRGHDFTAPSSEREHYGGAPDFLRMLREELIPWVEEHFRADPARRVIFGQSLGGQFVLYAAQAEPRLFWGHIASNPALHRNLDFFLRPITADTEARPRPRLFVSSGSEDAERFRTPALQWIAHWTAAVTPPWELRTTTLEGHSHFSAAPEAFRLGMAFLFESPPE